MAQRLHHHLRPGHHPSPRIGRAGAAFALTFADPDTALFVAADLLHRRVLVPMPIDTTIVLLPALTIADETADVAGRRIAAAVDHARAALCGQEEAPAC
ncbi:hypothetical protein KIF24_13210 [Micromonospora sp. Llam7]|nr:hypothetical protein [Micromonospora tarapacensis]